MLTRARKLVKRLVDLTVAVTLLGTFSPIIIAVALSVRIALGSPVVFHQERAGKDGKVFDLLKFRTMTERRDGAGRLLPAEQRLTKFGSALRRSSLDELPQLVNVVRGDMSLVGPRPLLPEYLDRYTETQNRRHEVLPGITGLAQVSGRNSLSWEEQFDLDVRYVDSWTLRGDMAILARTFVELFRGDSKRTGGGIIKEAFLGNDPGVNVEQKDAGERSAIDE